MRTHSRRTQSPVRRDHAESYVLTSLVAFAATVIVTRVFLELSGYPQLGNSVLHIAHALWGGLLLFVAVLLPLVLANRWALQGSALLGGVGMGLFIDEVGKFITQANDYFFAPALSIVYGFLLLVVFLYLYLRRPQRALPRQAMYHVLEGLQDVLDGDLDTAEASRMERHLVIAARSDRPEIVSLAEMLRGFLQEQEEHPLAAEPGLEKRMLAWVDRLGQRVGRRVLRVIISAMLTLWATIVIGYVVILLRESTGLDPQVVARREPLLGIQIVVGVLMIMALVVWLAGREDLGLKLATSGFLVSLVGLQTLYFYLSQFSAVTVTLLQLVFLIVLRGYHRWYLSDEGAIS
jgi:hypothetical protein